jgi:hypothetical protein
VARLRAWGGESLPEVSTGQNVISVSLSDGRPTFRGAALTTFAVAGGLVLISNTFRPISLICYRVQQARIVRNNFRTTSFLASETRAKEGGFELVFDTEKFSALGLL